MTPPRRVVYASHSVEAANMLAVWLDHRPECSRDQRDPDGWTKGAARTDFLVRRLAELAHAPNVEIVWQHGAAAEWWSRIDTNRRRAASRAKNLATKELQTLFPISEDIEEQGRIEGSLRAAGRGR